MNNDMKTLVFATQNRNKVREIEEIFSECHMDDWKVLTLGDIGFAGDIVEDGTTFEENAMIKVQALLPMDCVVAAEDSGLEIDALGGEPGVYSARYSGGHGNDDANNDLVMKKLADTPAEQRTARYVCAVACVLPNGKKWSFRGTCEGYIGTELIGCGGFGYDPLFFPVGFQKTFAQVTPEEKNAISHRGKAIRALAAWLNNQGL